jgi:hypothetical protein
VVLRDQPLVERSLFVASFPGSQRCRRDYAVQSLSGAPLLRGHAEGDAAVHEEPGRRALVEEALIVSYLRRVRLEMIADLRAGGGVAKL